jgi:DNA-binding transcriptional regulator YhcF (GntR family)
VITIDPVAAAAPFEQIRSQYARQIADGVLVAGTRLPTVRQLAADLGLAVNTVARAYRELEAGGLIETRGRAGTVVSARGDQARARGAEAAAAYARRTGELGLSQDEALALVRVALDAGSAG